MPNHSVAFKSFKVLLMVLHFSFLVFSSNRLWFGGVCTALIIVTGCANPVRNNASAASALPVAEISNGANQVEELSKRGDFLESAKSDFADWPDRIIEDSKVILLKENNLAALLLAGGASIAMHHSNADKNIAENFEKHQFIRGFPDESLNVIGGPGAHFAVTGLWYALSSDNQDEFNKQRAWTMMTALSVTGLVTVGLKGIRDNETPNGKEWAWPSGHTASSFTVASVLDEFYGPKVGIPAYVLASLVAYRMMDTGDHWASDVVFGATLGWVVGHTIAGKHKELEIAGFKVSPSIAGSNHPVMGISFVKQF